MHTSPLRAEPLQVRGQQRLEVEARELPLDLGRGPHAHPEQLDEPCRRALVELVPATIGRELHPVELFGRLAADHLGVALEELEANVAGDVALGLSYEGVEGLP